MPGEDIPTLENFSVAFCNSKTVLEAACRAGLPDQVEVKTNAPVLLLSRDANVSALEDRVPKGDQEKFWNDAGVFSKAVFDSANLEADTALFALTLARVAIDFHKAVHGFLGATEDDFTKPRVILLADTGDKKKDLWVNPKWAELTTSIPSVSVFRFPAVLPGKIVEDKAPLSYRLRLLDRNRIGYRLAVKFWEHFPLSRSRRRAIIVSDNELLSETAFALAKKGVAVLKVAHPGPDDFRLGEDLTIRIEEQTRSVVMGFLEQWFPQLTHDSFYVYFLDLAVKSVTRQMAEAEAWREALASTVQEGRTIILTNHTSEPGMIALGRVCRDEGIPLISFQHGVAAEICRTSDDWAAYYETSVSDVLVTFNDAAKEVAEKQPFAIGSAESVGIPGVYRNLKASAKENQAPILYVSTGLLAGNVNIKNGYLSDTKRLTREMAIAESVLQQLPHRVHYKTYPSLPRYTEPDPDNDLLRNLSNIELFDALIDLRYIVTNARVIVSARATSTISWCLMTGKPFVYIHMPEQASLRKEVFPLFEESVFLFDYSDPDVLEHLREFLSQPIDEIENCWRQKHAARRKMMEKYFSGPDGHAGDNAAAILEKMFVYE